MACQQDAHRPSCASSGSSRSLAPARYSPSRSIKCLLHSVVWTPLSLNGGASMMILVQLPWVTLRDSRRIDDRPIWAQGIGARASDVSSSRQARRKNWADLERNHVRLVMISHPSIFCAQCNRLLNTQYPSEFVPQTQAQDLAAGTLMRGRRCRAGQQPEEIDRCRVSNRSA
jgi:hypothetical protein